jgi:hypothetical protein
MAEGRGIVGGEGMGSGGISNVGVLDLTGMKSTEELAGIESISQVGVVLVPESLMSGLLGVPMEKVGATIAVPTGENVKLVTGQMKTTGEALEVPAGTVRYRIAMARKRLAELLRLEEDLGTKGRT